MEVDLTSAEVIFAQKLACGEPVTRQRAFRALVDWIKQQSKMRPFLEADMLRLCKGLHYVLWMQDKMILQMVKDQEAHAACALANGITEELADRISQLLLVFATEQERVLFIESTFRSLAKEWNHIDRWRMDKFLMMMRRVLRVLFSHLCSHKWKASIREPYWDAFSRTAISTDRLFPDGLKFHFASLVLDEMDNAGGISKEQLTLCLQPFADLLGVRLISDYLFDSVLEEIFATILHQKSEELVSMMDGRVNENRPGIEFDYTALRNMLFNIGKRPEITSKRRRKIYDLVKKFEIAAKGGDPYKFEAPVPEVVLTEKDYEEAEVKLQKMQEDIALERRRVKALKKNGPYVDIPQKKKLRLEENHEEDHDSTMEPAKVNTKKIQKVKTVSKNISKAKKKTKSSFKPARRKRAQ